MIVPRVDPMLVILDALESHGLPLADEAARRVHDALEDAGLLRPPVATDEASAIAEVLDEYDGDHITNAAHVVAKIRAALNAAQSGGAQ